MDAQCLAFELEGVWDDPLKRRRVQRGASLVEALAFLGTATVIAVNSVSLLGTAATDASSLTITQDTAVIQAGVRSLYLQKSGAYANLDASVLSAASMMPASLRVAGDGHSVTNQWGGNVGLSSVPGNPGVFMLSYSNVPSAICVAALTGASDNWVAIGVEGGSAGLVAPVDMTPSLAGQQCAGGASTVEWVSS